jgi:LCP family protein required for cell wall assembly
MNLSRALTRLLVVALAAVLVVGCGPAATPTPAGSSAPTGAAASPSPSPAVPDSPDASPAPSAAVTAAPSAALGGQRLNVLLVGLDNTKEREFSELTDTLIVASIDPVAGTASLLGMPRDLTDFPLPSGSTYRQKLNSLYAEIQANPQRFGGQPDEDPLTVLARVVGTIVGLEIDNWAAVDMDGFAGMIDALGGVDAYVQEGFCDAGYHQLGLRGFEAAPGWWHLTGPQALGLARVRKTAGGSDFQRLRRQLDLLTGIRDAVVAAGASDDPLGWIGRIPTIRTNVPPELIVQAGAVAATVSPGRIHSRLIQPFGNGGTELYDDRGYVLSANMEEIGEISALLFTDAGTRPTTGRPDARPEKPAEVPDLPRFNGC